MMNSQKDLDANLENSAGTTKFISESFIAKTLLLVLLAIGIVYVYFTITPSHYAVVLTQHLGMDYEPLFGEAREIRGDEYSVVTPYFQIAVNNDFERFNKHSPYNEDLRNFYGLPLADWALVFKPYMWGFWIFDAARAFSLYHYFMIVMFLVGITLFLQRLNLPIVYAAITAGVLFFTHHNQVWWTSNAPVLALTVWIVLPFLSRWSYTVKFFATFYIAMMALLALLYPAWQISLIYVFGIIALAFRRDQFKIVNLAICFFGFACACGLSYFYLRDIIPVMQQTVYPGNSSFSGGGALMPLLLSQFSPHSFIEKTFEPISSFYRGGINSVEIGTVSSTILTTLLCFCNYKDVFTNLKKYIWQYSILVVFFGLICSWMFLPIPSYIGQLLLFDRIGPHRFLLGLGTFVVLLSAICLYKAKLKTSVWRVLIYCFVVLTIPIALMPDQSKPFEIYRNLDIYDYLALLPLLAILIHLLLTSLVKNTQKSSTLVNSLVISALVVNIISFSMFNPIQQANDIFSTPIQGRLTYLKSELGLSTENLMAYEGKKPVNSSLAGLGLPSLNHTMLTPDLTFFKIKFPDLEDDKLNYIFNRFAKIATIDEYEEPELANTDLIGIPSKVGARALEVSYSKATLIGNQNLFPFNVYWGPIANGQRSLRLDFYSPSIFKTDSMKSSLLIEQLPDDLLAEVAIIPKPQLDYVVNRSEVSLTDTTIWNIYIDFATEDEIFLNNLPKLYKGVSLAAADSTTVVHLTKDIQVEHITSQTIPPEPITGIVQGSIEFVHYNPETEILRIAGWTPVENQPDVRWMGFMTKHPVQVVKTNSFLRPGIPLDYGRNMSKGFNIEFKLEDFDETNLISLCLYSATKDLGVFPIHNLRSERLNCDKETSTTVFEKLESYLEQPYKGSIDKVVLDDSGTILTLHGWAPTNPLSDFQGMQKWFGYYSESVISKISSIDISRPDVVKAYNNPAYSMSGFAITIELTEKIAATDFIELCLYSKNDEFGSFLVPPREKFPLISCRDL